MKKLKTLFAVCAVGVLGALSGSAEEGMFLPNRLPENVLQGRYNFTTTTHWRRLIQRASIRFPNGSGSFVSTKGLVFTNHHIAIDCAEKLSSEEDNIVENGFLAKTLAEERPCPDLELNVLDSIEDATEQVQAAVKPEMIPSEATLARRAVRNTLEAEKSKETGLKCEVVSLWHGARYHLYCYRRYSDVRLVFLPEIGIARFGGDPDNFEFPRYVLDIAFLRVYENGQPFRPNANYRWRSRSVREDELIYVTGHPGRTARLDTVDSVEFLRDTAYPQTLNILRRYEIALQQFALEGREQARRADHDLFSIQNSRKAYTGFLRKLQDPAFFAKKEKEEKEFRAQVEASPRIRALYASAWGDISSAEIDRGLNYTEYRMLESSLGFYSQLFKLARMLVRLAQERELPNAERLPEYSEKNIPRLEQILFSPAPIYKDLETAKLSASLTLLVETLGADDELVKTVLSGRDPRSQAFRLVEGTRLTDVAFRRKLAEGGMAAVRAGRDPMIELALVVDPSARRVRRIFEEAAELKRQGSTKLFDAMRLIRGTAGYPDATFTLRVSYGTVKDYREQGKTVRFATRLRGLYRRAEEHENLRPWKLPQRWLEKKDDLDPDTMFNFASTHDITGGNSGSPVISRQGEVVGIVFDSNLQGLGNEFAYSDEQGRAVSVSAQAVVEALRKVYDANELADELGR